MSLSVFKKALPIAPLLVAFTSGAQANPQGTQTEHEAFSCPDTGLSEMSWSERLQHVFSATVIVHTDDHGAHGSGFIVDPSGLIVTNAHVLSGAESISIQFYEQGVPDNLGSITTSFEIIGADPHSDLGVLKVNMDDDLPCLILSEDDKSYLGEDVFAIGSPNRDFFSLTKGIVSSVDRTKDYSPALTYNIQTNSDMDRGSSGGILFAKTGEVIGVNYLMSSVGQSAIGFNYAIPSSITHDVVTEIIEEGAVARGWSGLDYSNITLNFEKSGKVEKGVVITAQVAMGEQTDENSLRIGDVIVAVDGKDIDTYVDMRRHELINRPGDVLEVDVLRNGVGYREKVDFTLLDEQQFLKNNKAETWTPVLSGEVESPSPSLGPSLTR